MKDRLSVGSITPPFVRSGGAAMAVVATAAKIASRAAQADMNGLFRAMFMGLGGVKSPPVGKAMGLDQRDLVASGAG